MDPEQEGLSAPPESPGADPSPPDEALLEPDQSPTQRLDRVEPDRDDVAADERRRQLWRDSATILIGVVLALLVGQVVFPPATSGPEETLDPMPSTVAIGSLAPPISLPPGATIGPIVNPSLPIDATPTPLTLGTMRPTPSPSPTLEPSPSPSPKGSPKPSGATGAPPPPTAGPTPAPPVADFTWTASGLEAQFTDESTGETDWAWDFGDGDSSTNTNPSHTYAAPGDYSVTLTVTGPGGSDSVTRTVTVDVPGT